MYRYVILIHELVSIFMMTFNLKREIIAVPLKSKIVL